LCFHPRDSLSPLDYFSLDPQDSLAPGTRLSHSLAPPGLAPTPGTRLSPPRHSSHPPALPALLYAPSPAPLRSPTPRATPGALCSCTVNWHKVDSPSRLSP
ncbi:hypothetical protein C0993_000173, partial [Termitomyces sp. T159_Od127]